MQNQRIKELYYSKLDREKFMNNYKLLKFEDMNCLEQSVATYAINNNRNYEMMFAESWGFRLKGTLKDTIGEHISASAKINLEYLRRYHGINAEIKVSIDHNVTIQEIMNTLDKGNPAIFSTSCFYYPWNEHYHKFDNHLSHAILITDVNKETKKFICLDSRFQKVNVEIDFQDFYDGCRDEYWLLSCVDEFEKEINVKQAFELFVRKVTDNSMNVHESANIINIYRFAKFVKEDIDIKKACQRTWFQHQLCRYRLKS